ncbi:MAG: multidrug effflux MFS transporter [Alphaproteobacteria bacterium]|nr:multidrug effflux MFS transporter [Alphaproteobacteria bacterium]
MMHKSDSRLTPLMSTLAMSLVLMSSHLYIPALPTICDYYVTTSDLAQITLPLNSLGLCLSGLIYGPVSDVYGRRPLILGGMVIFLVFTMSCIFAPNIYVLILFRFLQGCGGGASMALGLVIINDLFNGEKCTQMLSRLAVVLTVAPAVAPVIGGYLTVFFGWQATFIFIAIWGSLVFILFLYKLPETLKPSTLKFHVKNQKSLALRSIFKPYLKLYRNRTFRTYAILHSVLFAGQWCFVAAAPFVFIKQLRIPPSSFGYYMSSVTFLYILGSFLIQRIALKVSNQSLIKWGLEIGIISSISFLVVTIILPENPFILCLMMSIYVSAAAFVSPAAATKALEINGERKGASASFLSSIRIAAGFIGSFTAGILEDIDFIKVGCFMLVCVLICFFTYWFRMPKTS